LMQTLEARVDVEVKGGQHQPPAASDLIKKEEGSLLLQLIRTHIIILQ